MGKKVEAGRKCSVSLESSQLHWDEATDVSKYFIMSFIDTYWVSRNTQPSQYPNS